MVEKLNQVVELNNVYKQLSYHIRQVLIEIVSGLNAKTAIQQHSTTIGVLRKLCWYSWEDKMVLMLAGFSIIYGEYIILYSRLCKGGSKLGGLVKKLRSLRQNNLVETPPSYTQKVVVDCLSSVLELTKCVVELKQCPYYSPPSSVILALPMATYWIATTLINVSAACACDALFKVHQNELGELTALIAKILATFAPELAKKKAEESFQLLRHAWYHNSSNRVELFRLMFNVENDDEEIFQRRRIYGLNYWRNDKTDLLLITSGFDISNEQIDFLNWFYNHASPFIIWIPIMEYNAVWTTEDERHFENVRERMYNLYLLNDPQKRLLPQFTRFLKEELFPKLKMRWGEEAILVSIDRKGRIVHPNVMHMILTWDCDYIEKNTIGVQRLYNITALISKEVKEGTSGVNRVVPEIDEMINNFLRDIGSRINDWAHLVEGKIHEVLEESTPYNSDREKDLWQQETTWSLHLLTPKFSSYQAIGKLINEWIQEEKYIFLYGGNDMKWVQEFTSKVHKVGSKTQINIELVYVGRNKKIRGIIDEKGMSHSPLRNSASVWWFWTRLRSMFLSRMHYLDVTNCLVEEYNNDEILQGLKKLLGYESMNTTIEGWALLCKGAKVIVCGHGTKMLRVMNEYQIWKENIAPKGFGQAFKDHHEMIFMNRHSCCTLEYPIKLDNIPENETCHECSRSMHKFLTFTCCHGHDVDSNKD